MKLAAEPFHRVDRPAFSHIAVSTSSFRRFGLSLSGRIPQPSSLDFAYQRSNVRAALLPAESEGMWIQR